MCGCASRKVSKTHIKNTEGSFMTSIEREREREEEKLHLSTVSQHYIAMRSNAERKHAGLYWFRMISYSQTLMKTVKPTERPANHLIFKGWV